MNTCTKLIRPQTERVRRAFRGFLTGLLKDSNKEDEREMLDEVYLSGASAAWTNQNNMKMKSVQATYLLVLETNGVVVKRNDYPFVPVIRATLIRALIS